ncbi:MAG: hypothetical protein J1F12_07500 [Muribaculaceae bacterium]|nr:hypothetical protein [Muribaculaceae bacterium]
MKLKKYIIIPLFFLCLISMPKARAQEQKNTWHTSQSINTNFKAVSSQPDIDVFSAPNIIKLKVNHDVEVSIYTILGKLVSRQYLHPGIYEFEQDAHGIYIIKTEETSCKVAI